MNKKYLVLGLFLVAALTTVNLRKINSEIQYPPAGSAGDPFTGLTCGQSGCHSSAVQNSSDTTLTFLVGTGTPVTPFDNSFTYVPSTVYNFQFTLNSPVFTNPYSYYGFQITALDNNTQKAGEFIAVNNNTILRTTPPTGTRQYMSHKGASAFKNWPFQWVAPAASTGPITFYFAYNMAGVDTFPPTAPHGTIYKGTITIQPNMSGINDINNEASDVTVFPNVVDDQFNLSFIPKRSNRVQVQLYTLTGQSAGELMNENVSGNFNRSFNIADMAPGVYLMCLQVGEASVIKKIVKQ